MSLQKNKKKKKNNTKNGVGHWGLYPWLKKHILIIIPGKHLDFDKKKKKKNSKINMSINLTKTTAPTGLFPRYQFELVL